ncbi:nucleotidyltransferase [Candidatus Bathyarchaeota archaeon]|nr:MAG: nucleotidyltransferase [Candidatus Bathyarchaeota archaeon]
MYVIETLRRHGKEIRERFSVRRMGVFGSYARGDQREGSDVDILVEFDKPTFDNFMDLSIYLKDLLGKEVDLVTPNSLSPYIRPMVEKEVVWCG